MLPANLLNNELVSLTDEMLPNVIVQNRIEVIKISKPELQPLQYTNLTHCGRVCRQPSQSSLVQEMACRLFVQENVFENNVWNISAIFSGLNALSYCFPVWADKTSTNLAYVTDLVLWRAAGTSSAEISWTSINFRAWISDNGHINTWMPRQNGRHFGDISKCIFMNENVWFPIKISLTFVPKGLINNISSLVQIMVWRRPGDKPLSEPMINSLPTHICVARPQWVQQWAIIFHPWPEFKCGLANCCWI